MAKVEIRELVKNNLPDDIVKILMQIRRDSTRIERIKRISYRSLPRRCNKYR